MLVAVVTVYGTVVVVAIYGAVVVVAVVMVVGKVVLEVESMWAR